MINYADMLGVKGLTNIYYKERKDVVCAPYLELLSVCPIYAKSLKVYGPNILFH